MTGILVHQQIQDLVRRGAIASTGAPIETRQIQPASLDLRLGSKAYRVRAGFLAESTTVAERLEQTALYEIDLTGGAILERGQCYIVPLLETITEPLSARIRSNPKSSTGRLDLFTRLLADHTSRFETCAPGYTGPLWLEIVPRSFPVKVHTGISLGQIRFAEGDAVLDDDELRAEYERSPLLFRDDGSPVPLAEARIDDGLCMGVATRRDRDLTGPIGWIARRYSGVVDLAAVGAYDAHDFFNELHEVDGPLIVEPEVFYIFASKERVRVPRHLAAEMAAYDVGIGELRTNYAGFFDNGFGGTTGTRAVLEVRAHDVPFLVEDGQVFFKLQFFRTLEEPAIAYGDAGLGSHYQGQGLKLSKHFRC
jgi:dCTP deaminase